MNDYNARHYQSCLDRAEAALDISTDKDIDADPRENDQTRVMDLLVHLRHYCERHGLSFESAVASSMIHFEAERPEDAIASAEHTVAGGGFLPLSEVAERENPRERGDDDGIEYGDPRDHRAGRE